MSPARSIPQDTHHTPHQHTFTPDGAQRGCPCVPRAASPLPALGCDVLPVPIPSTHSEMTSGGRFLGTPLESTQNAVSWVQEQLGGHGGGRGGRRPSAGCQSQAEARRRRRRAGSRSLSILLPRRSSIAPWPSAAPGAGPCAPAAPGSGGRARSSSLMPGELGAEGTRRGLPTPRCSTHHARALREGGREGCGE